MLLPQQNDNLHDHINTTFFCISPTKTSRAITETIESPHSPYNIYYIPSFDFNLIHDPSADPHLSSEEIIPQSGASAYFIRNDDNDTAITNSKTLSKPIVRRSLTHPLSINTEDAMNLSMVEDAQTPTPGSPPDLTGSKSSKSSSFHSSYQSEEDSILADVNHFEDIGLDDDARSEREIGDFDMRSPNPFTITYASDLRSKKRPLVRTPKMHTAVSQRELTSRTRPSYPSLRTVQSAAGGDNYGVGLGLMPTTWAQRRGLTSTSTPTLAISGQRHRSPSPNHSVSPHRPTSSHSHTSISTQPRRGSWQSNRERKSQKEREKEVDEEDGDDVPDEVFLENVPISPRPPEERARSVSHSPERAEKKERVRSIGNGTPPIPVAQGDLKSPASPGKPRQPYRQMSMGEFPIHHDRHGIKTRAKSWNAALSELSEEAKALTEALEVHAEEEQNQPTQKRSQSAPRRPPHRVRSMAELPPLRRTNIMIDPLPISKEKEAVLSRTRPSWLPPKNPSEEKRHLREYQRMMASSLEADRRRQAAVQQKVTCKDDTASSLLRIWEEHVLPNWEVVTAQRRTRELWWRGIAPRSRGTVWQRAIGNELELTEASYHAALARAKALEGKLAKGGGTEEEKRRGEWFVAIRKDVAATYPELRIFQPGGPLCQSLVDVLMAYAMYRSDVGYVRGTNVSHSFIHFHDPFQGMQILMGMETDNNSAPPPQSPHPANNIHHPLQRPQPSPPSIVPHSRLWRHPANPEPLLDNHVL